MGSDIGPYSPEEAQAYQTALDADFRRIDVQCLRTLESDDGVREALVRNRERGPHQPITFVNVPLPDAPVVRKELTAVHQLVERALNDPRREKAYYQLADRVHTTLLRLNGEADATAVFDEIRGDLDVPSYSYTLVGPHVTPDLIVILELRTASASLLTLRTRMRTRLVQAGYDVPMPTISHVTLARVMAASPAELRHLVEACAARRTCVHDEPVSATRLCVSRSRGTPQYEDRCVPLGA
jgi:hypothetical protein